MVKMKMKTRMLSVSNNALLIGLLFIGIFFGVSTAIGELKINFENDSIIFDVLLWVYYLGLLLIVSGIIYKIVRWRTVKIK